MSHETCGPRFLRCMSALLPMTDDKLLLFSAGHVVGQAEKVYLGACPAAMMRPSIEYRDWVLYVATIVSAVYGLEVSVFDRPEIADEIWLHQPSARGEVARLRTVVVNSPEWHAIRGGLCGVPDSEIDHSFHLRAGYREPCDRMVRP